MPTFSLLDIQFLLSRVNGGYTLPELNGAAAFGTAGAEQEGVGEGGHDLFDVMGDEHEGG